MNAAAYNVTEFDYLEEIDPVSGAPSIVAVPTTVRAALSNAPYNLLNNIADLFARENLREAWRVLRKNDPFDYQLEVADQILYSAMNGLGWYIVVMISRQAGKNEISAFVQHYLLLWGYYYGKRVSGVKFAPVHKPQVQASIDRLEGADTADSGGLAGCVITKKRFTKSDGYKYHIGKPRDTNKWAFLSINPAANVASQTAFTLLEADEAQDIDTNKWERDAQPMGAFNNATTVLYGVAWTKETFIYQGLNQAYEMEGRLEQQLGYRPKLVFMIDADRVIASGNENYKIFYDNLVARLGPNHIAVLTQFRLKFVDTIGKMLDADQLARMYANDYRTRIGPASTGVYIFSVDVGGQEENPTEIDQDEIGAAQHDYTILTVGELMKDGTVVPVCWYYWNGKAHTQQREQILAIIKHWRCIGGSCDATGIGEPLAYWLIEKLPNLEIEAYKFKARGDENKSKLGYLFLQQIATDKVKIPKRPVDNAEQGELWDELRWQLENLVRIAKKQQQINFEVPATAKPRREGHVPHDDLAIGLILLVQAAKFIKDPNRGQAVAFTRVGI